jgi:hypothetical protein
MVFLLLIKKNDIVCKRMFRSFLGRLSVSQNGLRAKKKSEKIKKGRCTYDF